jgi:hypothetical protein
MEVAAQGEVRGAPNEKKTETAKVDNGDTGAKRGKQDETDKKKGTGNKE